MSEEFGPAGWLTSAPVERVVRVGGVGADIVGFDGQAIQRAVDALGPAGGSVDLDAGVFDIAAPIRLSDDVRLRGRGAATVLRKIDGVHAPAVIDADYGELVVTLADTAGFAVGMAVQVSDDDAVNWGCSTSVVSAVTAQQVFLRDRLLRDYRADRQCVIANSGSVIAAVDARRVRIERLTIAGNKATNTFLNGCRGGGVYLYRCGQCLIQDVQVADFNGDGISWQITEDITLRDCEVSGCANYGLHPGTGSTRTQVTGCAVHHNGGDGLYVCWRVQQGRFWANRIHDNGGAGVSLGHKDTDNVFEDNQIFRNAGPGVLFRPESPANGAHRNHFRANRIVDNAGSALVPAIQLDPSAEDVVIEA